MNDPTRLTAYGWAPGNYWCTCPECSAKHISDKRSLLCRACAAERRITVLTAERDGAQSDKVLLLVALGIAAKDVLETQTKNAALQAENCSAQEEIDALSRMVVRLNKELTNHARTHVAPPSGDAT